MGVQRVIIPYRPRRQFLPLHESGKRWSCVVAHRRAGKTVAEINKLIKAALTCTKPEPRFAYIAPLYAQAKDVVWSYLKHFSAPIPGVTFNETELRADYPNGARVRLYGADNYDRMRGIYLDGVVMDEPADMDPRAWQEVIRPALTDRQGWADFIGTPKGRNEFCAIHERAQADPDWLSLVLKVSETGLIPEAELADARKNMTDDQYAQEFECSFDAAIQGAYYGKEMVAADDAKRLTSVPWEPAIKVHTAWDLGIGDATVVWFVQQVGKEIRLIDYYEASGEALAHYAKMLGAKPYVYGEHLVPHDAEVRELGTGKSRLEVLQSLGLRPRVLPAQSIEDGINAVRQIMPRCWFDRVKCERGIEALRQYRAAWDDKRKVLMNRPLHDWCFTGDTEVLTRYGTCRIMDLPQIGEVLTPCGWKRYTNPRVTRRNAPLVEVGFADGLTVRCTPDHLFKTASGWISAENLTPNTLIQSSLTRSRSISTAVSTASGRLTRIYRAAARSFIETYGNRPLASFRLVAMCTTGTGTRLTTPLETWSAWTPSSIFPKLGISTRWAAPNTLRQRLGMQPRGGTHRPKGGCGTVATPSDPKAGLSGSEKPKTARSAASRSWLLCAIAAIRRSFAAKNARWLNIVSVKPLSDRADVWCMTVPGVEAFSLSNGAVVHNCSHAADAFRYLALGLRPDDDGWSKPLNVNSKWIV